MSKGTSSRADVEGVQAEAKSKRLFVITPIGEDNSPERRHADWVLNAAVKPVFEAVGYTVYRSDTIDDPSMINDAIFNHIFEDDLCVADLTFLNPNVLYELGVRHSQLKPVIHIAHVGTRLPFDTAQHRAVFFDLTDWHSVERLKEGLAKQLATIEGDGFKVSNPITHARGRLEVARTGDDKDRLILDLTSRVESLERGGREASSGDGLPRIVYPDNSSWRFLSEGVSRQRVVRPSKVQISVGSLAKRIINAYADLPLEVRGAKAHDFGLLNLRSLFESEIDGLGDQELSLLGGLLGEAGVPANIRQQLLKGDF